MKSEIKAEKGGVTQDAVASTDRLGARARFLLALITAEERAHAYVQLNGYKWPDALAELKPSRWDKLSQEECYRSDEGREIWKALHEMTTPFDRSQAWWLERLGRTKTQHIEWWLKEGQRT